MERHDFESLVSALVRAGMVTIRADVFEKDGKSIPFHRLARTRLGENANARTLAALQVPAKIAVREKRPRSREDENALEEICRTAHAAIIEARRGAAGLAHGRGDEKARPRLPRHDQQGAGGRRSSAAGQRDGAACGPRRRAVAGCETRREDPSTRARRLSDRRDADSTKSSFSATSKLIGLGRNSIEPIALNPPLPTILENQLSYLHNGGRLERGYFSISYRKRGRIYVPLYSR